MESEDRDLQERRGRKERKGEKTKTKTKIEGISLPIFLFCLLLGSDVQMPEYRCSSDEEMSCLSLRRLSR